MKASNGRRGTPARALWVLGACLLALPAPAGDWHRAANLICSDCHTIHNSSGGLPMRYDGLSMPAQDLLRAEDPTHLCLACHDGSRPDAPDVVAPVGAGLDPAGGWFAENPLGAQNPFGHDLMTLAPAPAPGGPDVLTLTCLSCHTPHGNANHRNLLEEPPGSSNPGPVSVVVSELVGGGTGGGTGSSGGGGGPVHITPPTPGSGPGGAGSYESRFLLYKSGISAWCNDCHGDFHGRTGNEEGASEPWLRHPQDEELQGAYGADFVTPRVPVETPTDDLVPSGDDRVFCLSCHKAHGSDRPSGLIFIDGASRLSTCQQCHNH
jgi:hypothetical protein